MYVAQEDIRDYFYRLRISTRLQEYFCLPRVSSAALQRAFGGVLPREIVDSISEFLGTSYLYPRITVLPMGFSHAFLWAHEAHCEIVRRSLPGVPLLLDRRPPPHFPSTPAAVMVYADNANHIGVDCEDVDVNRGRLSKLTNALGLSTHDVVAAGTTRVSLGTKYDGCLGRLDATPERDARLDQSLEALIQGYSVSGDDLRRVLGHVTGRCLLRRPLLSILCRCYVFVQQVKHRQPLWPSVVTELRILRSLLIFAYADLRLQFCDTVLMYDASLSGYGVVSSQWTDADIRAVADYDERWRFRDYGRCDPRTKALFAFGEEMNNNVYVDPFYDIATVKPPPLIDRTVLVDSEFPEVPARLFRPERWKQVWCAPFRYPEPIRLCECRAALASVKHLSRNKLNH